MKSSAAIGVILMLLGGAILAWPVITYTDRDKVVDLGPVEITTETRSTWRCRRCSAAWRSPQGSQC